MSTQEVQGPGEVWDALAAGYDEYFTPINMHLSEDALGRVDLRPGMRFLDVAAGTGALSIPAAARGAEVLATDISPAMIEYLQARARRDGITNLEARVMDGHALDLDDDIFDVSGSQFGIMLFPDLPLGLRELVRVTKPGGRAVVIAFGPPPKLEFLGFFLGALKAVVPGFTGLPMDPPPLPFQVADPQRLGSALTDAGLEDVRVETTTHRMEFHSGAHFWNAILTSNPIASMLTADLTPETTTEVKRVLDGMLREHAGGSGPAVLDAEVNIGIGRK